ncbi:hypothetical protein A33M_3496 [Rhodovulum sp. PH10]|nr:hypothetical protein A33M_3496 [Rhodovulum sp. PH10]
MSAGPQDFAHGERKRCGGALAARRCHVHDPSFGQDFGVPPGRRPGRRPSRRTPPRCAARRRARRLLRDR